MVMVVDVVLRNSLFFVAITFIIMGVLRRRQKKLKRNLPPGPRALPVIGNLHQMGSAAHRSLQSLAKKHGPVMYLRLGSVPALVISSSDAVKEFLRSNDLAFASRPPTAVGKYICYNYRDVVFSPYNEYWRHFRKICVLQLLTGKRVESFRDIRYAEVDLLTDTIWRLSEGGTVAVDLSKAFATLTNNLTWLVLSGRKYEADEHIAKNLTFKEFIEGMSRDGGKLDVGNFIPSIDWMDLQGVKRSLKRLSRAYDTFAERIIRDHVSVKSKTKSSSLSDPSPEDFVDVLLEISRKPDSGFDKTNLKAILFDISAASTETSSTTMEWTMSLLLKNPNTLQKLQEEIDSVVGKDEKVREQHLSELKYLQCAVKEAMRLYPALPLALPHASTEDTKVCGYDIPKGSMLFLNLWAIGRDPQVWEDAEEFRPERFLGDAVLDLSGHHDLKAIPFSVGRRGCPGAVMALPLILLGIASVCHRFDWRVEGGPSQIDMVETPGLSIPRQNHLFAVPSLRSKC
eukprot:TRINITY_DN12564_c0_g1_i1.p1 TRINITY_DN12564_c0_g1~~TRINITY_DN12564_c0_g1_i1.p1  ORF type:complete len:513 (-),score=35.96 TRINITY_DN12564_c0_g1_i1:212-1750(-)